MKTKVLFSLGLITLFFTGYLFYCNSYRFYQISDDTGCATILINTNDTIMVGHNLDDYIEVPGAVYINKRGVKKENIGWTDFTCLCAKKDQNERIQWISKFGSVTYNTWGKDFIDGGMNEEGLYIGEMTLLGTTWIKSYKPAFHHHFFMQYVLDNFSTTEEVVSMMDQIRIEGHCQWHYFVADRSGNTAVIEFINGKMTIYQKERMPYKVLCNRAYEKEMKMIPGSDSAYNRMLASEYVSKDLRFMYAARKLNEYDAAIDSSISAYVFSILKGMNMGNNKWSVVYDLKNLSMYFRTSKGPGIKYINFESFDFSCSTPVKVFDINSDTSGAVSSNFQTYSEELNREFIRKNFEQINFGLFGNLFIKGRYQKKISRYTNSFFCTESRKISTNP